MTLAVAEALNPNNPPSPPLLYEFSPILEPPDLLVVCYGFTATRESVATTAIPILPAPM